MGALKTFYETLASRLEKGEALAVASIARRIGSAPRNQGARCVVDATGAILGTIGGGLMEARTQEEGVRALNTNRAVYLKMRLDSKQLAEAGMICGGSVDILAAPWTPDRAPVARELLRIFMANERACLVTAWDEKGAVTALGTLIGEKWNSPDPLPPGVPEAAAKALESGNPVVLGKADGPGVLVEPIEREKSPLVVFGAGHVGKALAAAATLAGFTVTLVDDREEFANPALHPWADRVVCRPFEGAVEALGVDETTFVVICTRGHLMDSVVVVEAMRSPSPYVGMIGSRRKKGMVLKMLAEAGITEERIAAALHAPVGLEIAAETPEEIAVSITAELIAVKRGGAAAA